MVGHLVEWTQNTTCLSTQLTIIAFSVEPEAPIYV